MRRACVVVVTGLLMVLAAVPAWGHAQLAQASVPANTDQRLTIRALSERPPNYNSKVEVLVPAAFDVKGCVKKSNWTCDAQPFEDGTLVTFNRTAGADLLVDDTYDFDVRTAKRPGVYLFKTIQTYNDGYEARWINEDADGDGPSPRLEVTAGGEVEENEEPAPEHSENEKPSSGNGGGGDNNGGGKKPEREPAPQAGSGSSADGRSSGPSDQSGGAEPEPEPDDADNSAAPAPAVPGADEGPSSDVPEAIPPTDDAVVAAASELSTAQPAPTSAPLPVESGSGTTSDRSSALYVGAATIVLAAGAGVVFWKRQATPPPSTK